ncbi:hypothetical protein AAG906_039076 [Vitis piasezkii]
MMGKPYEAMAQEAYPGPSAPVIIDRSSHLPAQQPIGGLTSRGPPGSVSRRLDDMLSTPFTPNIINYEPLIGFIVPKFSMYDGSSDPFDHIMHYKELVKQFRQAVLQVESYSMDVVLQIFKMSICPGTPFFESLTKKPPMTMDDLFKKANKYSILEDDVRATTQPILVTSRPAKNDLAENFKTMSQRRQTGKRQDKPQQSNQATLTSLSILYEKLLPMIRELSDFRWPEPIKTDSTKRDRSRKLHLLKGKMRANIQAPTTSATPRVVINYIHEGPVDEKYNSKRKRQNNFDVRRVLVYPGSYANLLQMSAFKQMGFSPSALENPGRTLSRFNRASSTSLGDVVLLVQARPLVFNVQFLIVEDLSSFNTIMGRTWLHGMKAIPFTYHQMVSYLTENRQVNLFGSQLAARQCYHVVGESRSTSASKPPTKSTRTIAITVQNKNVFVWTHSDMSWIHPSIASHRLNVMSSSKLVHQKVRYFHMDRQKIIQAEIDKLLAARFIREVEYPKWYHQIPMYQPNEEKTAFIMPHGLFCYKVMSFGLENVGAIYQRLMAKIFKPLIGRMIKVYIDNIVVKTKTRIEHARHLEEIFHLIRGYKMRLNSVKCTFRVNAGKFLGFMVTQRGIKVNPNQIKVVMKTSIPSCKNELQCLTSRLLAFEDIKSYLTQPPILSSPQPGEQLYMYLAVSNCVVSVVLFRYIKDNEQRPFYYVSKAMVDAETRYSRMEQTALALRSVARKLRPCFQAHQVIILTNQLLRNILHKPDLSGRMVRWVIELDEYKIKYQPKLAMKGQVMVDFIAETSQKLHQRASSLKKGWWTLHNKLSNSYFQPLIMKSSMRQSSPN